MSVIARLDVLLGADTKQFDDRMKRSQGTVAQWTTAISTTVSAATDVGRVVSNVAQHIFEAGEAIADYTLRTYEEIDAQAKIAERLHSTQEELAAVQLAGDLAGISIETFDKGIAKLGVRLGDARNGEEAAAKAFERLGLSVDELEQMSGVEQFLAVADAIAAIPSPSGQASAAVDIFGRSATEMIAVLRRGRGEIDDARGKVQQYGLALTEVQTDRIEAANDQLTLLSAQMHGVGVLAVADFAPSIVASAQLAGEALTSVQNTLAGINALLDQGPEGAREFLSGFADGLSHLLPGFEVVQSAAEEVSQRADLVRQQTADAAAAQAAKAEGDRAAQEEIDRQERLLAAEERFQSSAEAYAQQYTDYENQMARADEQAAQRHEDAGQQMIDNLQEQIDTFHLTAAAAAAYRAQQAGLTDDIVEQVRTRAEQLDRLREDEQKQEDARRKAEADRQLVESLHQAVMTPEEALQQQLGQIERAVLSGLSLTDAEKHINKIVAASAPDGEKRLSIERRGSAAAFLSEREQRSETKKQLQLQEEANRYLRELVDRLNGGVTLTEGAI